MPESQELSEAEEEGLDEWTVRTQKKEDKMSIIKKFIRKLKQKRDERENPIKED